MNGLKRMAKAFLPHGRHPRKILRGPASGLLIELDLSCDTQVWMGRYESAVLEWTKQRVKPGAVCVDVGASEGVFTLLLARAAGPTGRVISVEPDASRLRRSIALNAKTPLAPIEVIEGFAGNGESNTASLDALILQRPEPALSFVKIDVDGAELQVLEGIKGALQKFQPPLALELHSEALRDACIALLHKIGYRTELHAPACHEHRPLEYNMHLFAEAK